MREIKFRVWRSGERGMYYFPLVYKTPGRDEWSVIQLGLGLVVDVMQYTGLKDKNGKEIYEGDILGYDDEDSVFWVISWDKKKDIPCGFIMTSTIAQYTHPHINRLIVRGNIYDNPELLEKKP